MRSLQQHTYCYVAGCETCKQLEDTGLFRGIQSDVVEGAVCGHINCACTFSVKDRSGKSHHLKNHVQYKRKCSLCAKHTASELPGE